MVALALAAAAMGLAIRAPQALAAAEEHRFNLVLSATPSSLNGGDFNKTIDNFNQTVLDPWGRESLEKVTFAWLFQAKLSYLVRQNVAVSVGVGQIKSATRREYLPALQQSATVNAELVAVPVDVGATYYMQPYNQGDFRARAFLGGGVTSSVYNRTSFEIVSNIPNPADPLSYDGKVLVLRDSPGWYAETGVHMFFASRFSVIISALYRNMKVAQMVDEQTRLPAYTYEGKPFMLDLSGLGIKGAVGIGF
jgi:hypothetical protein